MLRTFLILSVISIIFFGTIACDSNQVQENEDPALAEPDNETIAKAGPANQVVSNDISTIIKEMGRLLYVYIPKAFEQDTGLDEDSADYEKASVDVCIPDNIENNVTCNVDVSPLIEADCDSTGSKTITSFVTITVEEDGMSGSFDGNFSLEYSDDCQETPTMEVTGSSTCEATTTMSGTLVTRISNWTFQVSSESSDVFDSEFSIEASTEEDPLTVVVAWYNTQQNYELDYTAFTSTSLTNLQPDDDSTLEVDDIWYYVDDLAGAVAEAAAGVACYE